MFFDIIYFILIFQTIIFLSLLNKLNNFKQKTLEWKRDCDIYYI